MPAQGIYMAGFFVLFLIKNEIAPLESTKITSKQTVIILS
jgi:hypothetical protein